MIVMLHGIRKEVHEKKDDSRFRFKCKPSCAECCKNSIVVLSPYEIYRICKSINTSFAEFLEKHALLFFDEKLNNFLSVKLRTTPECTFLDNTMCTVYENRPLACRLYPVGHNWTKTDDFFFFAGDNGCPGFKTGKEWNLKEWKEKSEIKEFFENSDAWKKIKMFFVQNNFSKEDRVFLKYFYVLAYDIFSEENKQLLEENNMILEENPEARIKQSLELLESYIKSYFGQKD